MLSRSFELIDTIVKSKAARWMDLNLELFAEVFQKPWTPREQKKLFLYAVVRLNDALWIDSETRHHLFTASLDDKFVLQIQSEDALRLISVALKYKERYANKERYPGGIVRSALKLYKHLLTNVEEKYRFVAFWVMMRSGFLPFDAPYSIFVDTDDQMTEEEEDEFLKLIDMVEWVTGDQDDYSMANYMLNMINAYADDPHIQVFILQNFASHMKGRGYVQCRELLPQQTTVDDMPPGAQILVPMPSSPTKN